MKYTPHAYQAYCEKQIVDKPALALWLEMGLGKTIITLSAIQELKYNRFAVNRVLIVAPKKVAEATWQTEARKWDHTKHLRFSTIMGNVQQRIRRANALADVYVVNRDNLVWLVDYYRNAWPFDMVILDESTSFKNHQSKRWKALKSIQAHISRTVELTGTPSPQGLLDLWAQVYLLDQGERLGKSIGQFRTRYFDPDKRNATTIFTYKPRTGTEQAVKDLLSDICVSMKAEDYINLPDCIYDVVPVALDPAAEKAYRQLERDAVLQVDEDTINAGTAAVLANKLLQLCDGAVYDDLHKIRKIHDCKIEALQELVEGLSGEHLLLFYAFQHDRDRIVEAFSKTRMRVRVYSGPEDADAWNAGQVDILLAHPASCAYGLNLQQGGHHVCWFGLNWSLELYQQANARLHRQGQDKPVFVHHLVVQDGMDQEVMAALESKAGTQEGLMQALKARIDKVKQEVST